MKEGALERKILIQEAYVFLFPIITFEPIMLLGNILYPMV
jgi:hypothetical protein